MKVYVLAIMSRGMGDTIDNNTKVFYKKEGAENLFREKLNEHKENEMFSDEDIEDVIKNQYFESDDCECYIHLSESEII